MRAWRAKRVVLVTQFCDINGRATVLKGRRVEFVEIIVRSISAVLAVRIVIRCVRIDKQFRQLIRGN